MATFTNQATLTYNGQTTTSNVTVGELTETLTAAKTAVVPTYGTDGRVTYILSLVNSGTAPLTGLTITDDLGGYAFNAGTVYPLSYTAGSVRYYQNGVLQAAPAVTAGPPLTFTGITVPAGGSAHGLRAADGGGHRHQQRVHYRRGAGKPRYRHGDGGTGGGAGTDHQQVPLPHHGDGEQPPDVHLHHPEHRQHGGGRRGGHRYHRHLRPATDGPYGDAERHGADRPHPVHL